MLDQKSGIGIEEGFAMVVFGDERPVAGAVLAGLVTRAGGQPQNGVRKELLLW